MARHASIVPATAEHFTALKGASPPRTVRAYTAVRGEDVIGIAGTYKEGIYTVLFSELTDEIRSDKRTFVRLVRMVMPLIEPLMKGQTLAHADPAIRGSDVLLKHLGFEKLEGDVWVR